MKVPGRPPTLTAAQMRRAQEVRRIRASLPTYVQLAREWGVSVSAVQQAASRGIKRYASA